MRVFAISDIHIDYAENRHWITNLSKIEYKRDILLLAGDISDDASLVAKAFTELKSCFKEVLFVPGNHDLWVLRDKNLTSPDKFELLKTIADTHGVHMKPYTCGSLSVVPLFAWYDYTFGQPSNNIIKTWMDYYACKWPQGYNEKVITEYFLEMNEPNLGIKNEMVISFSHFLPRIDVMPVFIPPSKRELYPVLGSDLLDRQVSRLGANIHVFGHSHVNINVVKENVLYINNAYGYPHEFGINAKSLRCVYENNF